MKLYLISVLMLLSTLSGYSQSSYKAVIKNSKTNEPLPGVTALLKGTLIKTLSNQNGYIQLDNIPDGEQIIQFSSMGFDTRKDTLTFPVGTDTMLVLLDISSEEIEEVVITSTRSSRTIQNIPSRVEYIGGEELEEKGNMKPGDIRMMLSESTGIQTQQTSATSANSSIRIQGLDGRYTQLLKDGFPLYSGASSGLGLLQTPPLDLKQVEIIKGSASTLYGGGAIAGLVNLISKTPSEERELRFHLNGTSASGLDLNGFYGHRLNKKIGLTVFASRNSNAAYDPADIDLTAIPKFERYNFNPKLFVYFNDRTKLDFGLNTAIENRTGGDLHYINGDNEAGHSYFENNKTQRISSQFSLHHTLNEKSQVNIRNSYNYFDRKITIPAYEFKGIQNSTFTESTYSYAGELTEWVAGGNLLTDDFKEKAAQAAILRDYKQTTLGVFIQNTVKASKKVEIETGLRGDYVIDYGFVILPRISALYKITNKLSSRIGAGLGYKAPTVFTEESERIQYRNVMPVSSESNSLEKSYGANLDVNYKTVIGDKVTFSLNHLFFYTFLNNPLILLPEAGNFRFRNSEGHTDTKGTETNVKLGFHDFKVFLGYTFTDAFLHDGDTKTPNPLTPKHRVNSVVMYEVEDKWKIGAEAYYFGKQRLSTGGTGRSYLTTGFMAERLWEKFSLYINFENYLDTRQTKFESIYTGTLADPVFKDIYAPLDGFVVNGGLKIRL
ncbi:TonB-dependent receptor [Pedobacter sp. P351]|uniref:TonB-dependent receptor n=1 Tax=Pedobacter superstes TaxID=3133441 RepID=UPI0030ACE30F